MEFSQNWVAVFSPFLPVKETKSQGSIINSIESTSSELERASPPSSINNPKGTLHRYLPPSAITDPSLITHPTPNPIRDRKGMTLGSDALTVTPKQSPVLSPHFCHRGREVLLACQLLYSLEVIDLGIPVQTSVRKKSEPNEPS